MSKFNVGDMIKLENGVTKDEIIVIKNTTKDGYTYMLLDTPFESLINHAFTDIIKFIDSRGKKLTKEEEIYWKSKLL